ncbi:CNP1-like family protein [Ramlibacter sp. MMS24-I3-19]|uniref:CNP1-like family protein n=1 Tax=Ramlibacter sp. MMS24-I3-19 TaxID=3416606 RepID=UPI003D04B399
MLRKIAGWLLAMACTCAAAQVIPSTADWQEGEAPPPPALKLQGLVPVEVGRGSELRWGVDPASIRIGPDRVVRYVVIGQGQGGAVNAYYEGLRCDTAEVRVYARHARDGDWTPTTQGWKSLQDPSARHSLVVARTGACLGQAPNRSSDQIARDLAQAPNYRFLNEAR